MPVLTVDQSVLEVLNGVHEATELRDARGKLLGVFTPAVARAKPDYVKLRELFNLEDGKRTMETERGNGRPLAEIMERLKSS